MDISATYPYRRTEDFAWLGGAERIPKQILDYLCDFPLPGYEMQTDNSYPRVRLMKLLYYDCADPLSQPALTLAQKRSILYDPKRPDDPPDQKKGYRLLPLMYTEQAQLVGQTMLRCYVSRVVPTDDFQVQIGLTFEILSSMAYATNLNGEALDRTWAIEQCLWECLHGVQMTGVGTIYADRRAHGDSGSRAVSDENMNTGRIANFALTWMDSSKPPHQNLF